jgi:hypothetical protein
MGARCCEPGANGDPQPEEATMPARTLRAAAGLAASATLALTVASATAPARASQAACSTGWVVKPSPTTGAASLSAVAATSAKDVWAVGSFNTGGAFKTLIEHWDGAHWTIVPSKNPASGTHTTNTLGAVVALTPKNAWAFGFYEKTTTSFRTLIEHWDGVSWSVVPSPNNGPGENALLGATARSSTDIWAVGYHNDPGNRRTLTEHWNGSAWSIVASPSVGSGDNFLFAVAGPTGRQLWAVGSDSVSFGRTLAVRWNGTGWTVGRTANPGDGDRFLQGVAVPGARIALAVGSDLKGNQTRALAERWTGSGWSVVPAASPAADYNSLQAIAAAGTRHAWAVGTRRATPGSAFRTLAEHWNGTSWSVAASPSPGTGDDMLCGLAKVPGGGYWAVGSAGDSTLTEFHC